MNDYCPTCAPSNCFGEECGSAGCDNCACDVDMDDVAMCWSCGIVWCDDCIDAHGWPCEHFTERDD